MTSIKHLILQRKQHSYKDVLKEAVHRYSTMVAKSIENFHETPLKKFHFYKVAELKSAELDDCNLNFCCTGSQEN